MIEDHNCFQVFPVLHSQSMVLKEITLKHVDDFSQFAWRNGAPIDSKDCPDLIRANQERYKNKTNINWGIFLDAKLIGAIGFYRGFKNMIGEIGYVLHESYRKRGVMKEAVELVLNFGFKELRLNKIQAFTEQTNLPSVALLEGFHFENTGKNTRNIRFMNLLQLLNLVAKGFF